MEPPGEGETNVYVNGPGLMTKMTAMSCQYRVKTFKDLLQNQKSYDLETLHAASLPQALQS